ncbi:MAG: hypothetical protein IPH12_07625 [Saprospirales bacterium]|nr:hypothetical protein [Saprospirales bacterium]MBK8920715.1 hypothetical protein [Saprospirales bacterium]
MRKSGSNWSIVGVTRSHADNVRGISTFAKHFPPGILLKRFGKAFPGPAAQFKGVFYDLMNANLYALRKKYKKTCHKPAKTLWKITATPT